jgi:starch phosphorylase
MKLMANGAITLATMDGANIEIADAVGEDNIVTFGMTVDEVGAYTNYSSQAIFDSDKHLQKVVNALIDGTIPNITREGRDIYNSLLQYNDEYFVLADYESYVKAQDKISTLYQDPEKWYSMACINIAKSGQFSSDLTIARYGDDIWHLTRDQVGVN